MKTKHYLLLLFLMNLSSLTWGQSLAQWDFAGTNTPSSSPPDYQASGVNVSDFTAGNGIVPLSYNGGNAFTAKEQLASSLTEAISQEEYFTFTLTPANGQTISISDLQIRPVSQNTSRTFAILSSHSGFDASSVLGSFNIQVNVEASLQSIPISNHNQLAEAVEFRIYVYGGTNKYEAVGLGAGDGDDLIVNGQVDTGSSPFLTVSSSNLDFPAAGGSQNVSISSNINWQASTAESWITLNPASGSNNGNISISVASNDAEARSGSVTVSGEGISRTINISQDAGVTNPPASGELASWEFTGTNGAGSVDPKTSMAGLSVTATSFGQGLTALKYGDGHGLTAKDQTASNLTDAINGSEYITFSISPESGNDVSITKVDFRPVSQNVSRTFTLMSSVNGFSTSNTLGATTVQANQDASMVSIELTNHVQLTSSVEFRIYISGGTDKYESCGLGRGTGDDLIVYGSMNGDVPPPPSKELSVSPSSLSYGQNGGSASFNISSNVAWTISASQSWITLDKTSGANNSTITVTTAANGSDSRNATITINGEGLTATVNISQAGEVPPVSGDWPKVGVGLNGVNYYQPYCPFNDAVKAALWWYVGSWDENGCPKTANGQQPEGWIGVDNGRTWKDGIYTLTWEGSGDVSIFADATLISEDLSGTVKKRRYQMEMTNGDKHAIKFRVNSFPATKIHIYLPGQEDNPSLWNPEYTEYMKPFVGGVLRMMDLGHTNHSKVKKWSDRTPRDWASYSSALKNSTAAPYVISASYEAMIELANEMNTDMWVCIPHEADDDFVRKLATLIKTGYDGSKKTTEPLKSNLRVWIEYSNEVWNWGFSQSHYVNNNTSIPGNNFHQRLGNISKMKTNVFRDAFGDPERVVRIIGTQTGYGDAWVTKQILEVATPHVDFDAIAVTTYFAHGIEQWMHDNWNQVKDNKQMVLNELAKRLGSGPFTDNEFHSYSKKVGDNLKAAREAGIPIVAYEGNSHLITSRDIYNGDTKLGKWFDVRPESVDYIHDLERMPAFAALYEQWIERYEQSGLVTNVPFVMLAGWSKWGQWGHVEYVGQPIDEAPKFKMLLDHYNLPYPDVSNLRTLSFEDAAGADPNTDDYQILAYPNPVSDHLQVIAPDASQLDYQLINVKGEVVKKAIIAGEKTSIMVNDLVPGLYILKVNQYSSRIIIK
ncbi:BACON domain-containing protein [Persicobacter diffluens]|uniref:Secreted protein (Por secretion system target) n=1 Tax=Persicobacter diffluens TaxID=981 RepID=A0AAN5APY9_9BACT|nr:hypothetical protein PEDI_48850 [Persicobacter diffluens]